MNGQPSNLGAGEALGLIAPEVMERAELPETRGPNRLALYQSMGYTLAISVRFLFSAMLKRASVTYGDGLLKWWSTKIFEAANAGLQVAGREAVQTGRPYIFMSNHRSILDIPAVFLAVPTSLRMVLKDDLLRIPVWGTALRNSGFVPVSRGKGAKAIRQLDLAKVQLNRGISIWIAPEGTRSRDGQLAAFKKGGFHMAIQLGIPIVPIWLEGTDRSITPDSFMVHYGQNTQVSIAPPIETKDLSSKDIPALMAQVRSVMVGLSGEPDSQSKN